MKIAYLLLIAFGIYAAVMFWKNKGASASVQANLGFNAPGVGYYDPLVATHRPQQIEAFQTSTPGLGIGGASVTQPGYAPAFGPGENQPSAGEEYF